MAGLTGSNYNPSWKLISGYLNGENNAALGSPIASSGLAGGIVSSYGGFLGTKGRFDADDAGKLSNTTIGTLYGGTYMMVRVAAAAAQANLVRGRLVYFDTSAAEDFYQVTNDETQNGGMPLVAGVLLNSVTAGNYTIIQTEGRATLQMRATVTAASRYITLAMAGAGVDNATADGANPAATVSTAASALTLMTNFLGVGESVASNGSLIIVNLKPFITRQ